MKPEELEQLLYEEESPTLDFKRDQYAFAKATDEDKSELLKDIIGFVNCWRRSNAYILIGVDEVQGARSTVHGITLHLQDHSLQQFVNSLTNRPVQFGYEAAEIEGKQVGIIRIELQRRPIFLKHDYGKLKKGEVYVRRGTSTDPTKPADPDEIAHMGSGQNFGSKEASLAVEFAAPDREQSLGDQFNWTAEFCELPEPDEIPTLSDQPAPIHLPDSQTIQLPSVASFNSFDRLNRNFYHELCNYVYFHRFFKKIRLVVVNSGDAPATDVRVELCVPNGSGFGFVAESNVPIAPKRRVSVIPVSALHKMKFRHAIRHAGDVNVERNDYETKVEIECGNLQPGRKVWTDAFYLGVRQSGQIQIVGSLFAANLPKPPEFKLSVNAKVAQTAMTVADLVSLAERNDSWMSGTEEDEQGAQN